MPKYSQKFLQNYVDNLPGKAWKKYISKNKEVVLKSHILDS